jgi:hypothetical protein
MDVWHDRFQLGLDAPEQLGGGPSGEPHAAQPLEEFKPVVRKAGDWLTQHFGEKEELSTEQQESLDAIRGLWKGQGSGSGVGVTGLSTLKDVAGGKYLGSQDPYLASITSGLTKLTQQRQGRDISDIEARYGARGNPMSSEAARAVGDYSAASGAGLERALGELNLSAYQQERNRMQEASKFGAEYDPALARLLFESSGVTDPKRAEDRWLNWLRGILPSGTGYTQHESSGVGDLLGAIASIFIKK